MTLSFVWQLADIQIVSDNDSDLQFPRLQQCGQLCISHEAVQVLQTDSWKCFPYTRSWLQSFVSAKILELFSEVSRYDIQQAESVHVNLANLHI